MVIAATDIPRFRCASASDDDDAIVVDDDASEKVVPELQKLRA